MKNKATHSDIEKLIAILEKKVDHTDFDPIKTILSRINWLMITGVVTAILALIIKVGN